MGVETVTNIIDKIPDVIAGLRNAIIAIFGKLPLPDKSYLFVFILLALFISYKWIKQWIVYSVFSKFSTILNWILLAVVIYLLLVYV